MDNDTGLLFDLPSVARKKVSAAFDGGRITSDGGVALLALADRRIGVIDRIARLIADRFSSRLSRASLPDCRAIPDELTRHSVLRGPSKRKPPPAGALTLRSQSAPAKFSGMPGVVVSLGRPAVNYRKVGVTLETLLRYHRTPQLLIATEI